MINVCGSDGKAESAAYFEPLCDDQAGPQIVRSFETIKRLPRLRYGNNYAVESNGMNSLLDGEQQQPEIRFQPTIENSGIHLARAAGIKLPELPMLRSCTPSINPTENFDKSAEPTKVNVQYTGRAEEIRTVDLDLLNKQLHMPKVRPFGTNSHQKSENLTDATNNLESNDSEVAGPVPKLPKLKDTRLLGFGRGQTSAPRDLQYRGTSTGGTAGDGRGGIWDASPLQPRPSWTPVRRVSPRRRLPHTVALSTQQSRNKEQSVDDKSDAQYPFSTNAPAKPSLDLSDRRRASNLNSFRPSLKASDENAGADAGVNTSFLQKKLLPMPKFRPVLTARSTNTQNQTQSSCIFAGSDYKIDHKVCRVGTDDQKGSDQPGHSKPTSARSQNLQGSSKFEIGEQDDSPKPPRLQHIDAFPHGKSVQACVENQNVSTFHSVARTKPDVGKTQMSEGQSNLKPDHKKIGSVPKISDVCTSSRSQALQGERGTRGLQGRAATSGNLLTKKTSKASRTPITFQGPSLETHTKLANIPAIPVVKGNGVTPEVQGRTANTAAPPQLPANKPAATDGLVVEKPKRTSASSATSARPSAQGASVNPVSQVVTNRRAGSNKLDQTNGGSESRKSSGSRRAIFLAPEACSGVQVDTTADKKGCLARDIHPGYLPVGVGVILGGRTYRIEEQIGQGGYSKVYRVSDDKYQKFALKVCLLERDERGNLKQAYQKAELDLLQRLQWNDKVVKLHAHELQRDALFLVLELGLTDFASVLRARRKNVFELHYIRSYAREILECVRAVHDEGIVHSDLKPGNFLLTVAGLKLIDFGLSKVIPEYTENIRRSHYVGTPSYSAPEALSKRADEATAARFKIGKPSDVWGCGCILFTMVYKRHLFEAEDRQDIAHKILDPSFVLQVPDQTELGEPVPPSLVDLISSCLRRDPNSRPTIHELLNHQFFSV